MNGRIIIDLMKVMQRDYKLDSYKLDNVSAYFIKELIKGYNEEGENSIIYTDSVYGIIENQYINILYKITAFFS